MSRLLALISSLVLLLGLLPMTASAVEPKRPDRPLPASIEAAKLGKPITSSALKDKVHTSLAKARGPQRVVVKLSVAPSVAQAANGAGAQAAQLAPRQGPAQALHQQRQAHRREGPRPG